MSAAATYANWKAGVLGHVIGDGQCVALVVNNPRSYTAALFPGVSWPSIMGSVDGAKDLASKGNQYLTWIENDHNNPNQVPEQGDIMIFGATPQAGYSNQFNNPYGHTGVCESASASGYALCQQNSPASGAPANVTNYPWKYRPCLGWYRPNVGGNPAPAPSPAPSGQTITLPKTTGPWHLYVEGGPYNPNNPADVKGIIDPRAFQRDLEYPIVASRGNGVYTIDSEDYGRGDLYTNGSDVVIG